MMTPPAPTARDLVAEIRTAFASVSRPAAGELVPATITPDRERERIRQDFAGRGWTELTVDFLARHAESLLLLSAAGFHHFLPAYLIASAVAPAESDLVTSAVFVSLMPPDEGDVTQSNWLDDRVRLLSAGQRAAVGRWLDYMAENRSDELPRGARWHRLREFWNIG